jgi:hypothetical protein
LRGQGKVLSLHQFSASLDGLVDLVWWPTVTPGEDINHFSFRETLRFCYFTKLDCQFAFRGWLPQYFFYRMTNINDHRQLAPGLMRRVNDY